MKKRLVYIGVFGLLLAVLGGGFLYLGHQAVRKKGYAGIVEYLSSAGGNYARGLNAAPTVIDFTISENDMARLQERRDQAVQQGLMLNIGDNYVPAKVTANENRVDAEVRLKGHMTDHLQEKKWSFRIKCGGDDRVMGMRRFTLQHPGTRSYVNEWIYHELAKDQGLVHLRYDFVELRINGESWGVYALEEHFGLELLEYNGRPKGALLRFDPALYWHGRINEKERVIYDEDYTSFNAAHLDPYSEGSTLKDSLAKESLERAVHDMEAFRRRELQTSDIFDTKLLAKFLAIVDVVGGHRSLDWSDVKFYSNPETKKLEPVAYESFSVQRVSQLAGQGRSFRREGQASFHDLLFEDMDFFAEYIKALDKLADAKRFKEFMHKISGELKQKEAILAREFAYKPVRIQPYYDNIKIIKRMLDQPDPLKIYLNDVGEESAEIVVGNVSHFPVIITEFSSDGEKWKPDTPIILDPKGFRRLTTNHFYSIPNPIGRDLRGLKVSCEIPGGKDYRIDAFEYRFEGPYEFHEIKDSLMQSEDLPNVHVDSVAKVVQITSGDLGALLRVPDDYELVILPGTEIICTKPAVIVASQLRVLGTEEAPVVIKCAEYGSFSFNLRNGNATIEHAMIQAKREHPAFLVENMRTHMKAVHISGEEAGISAQGGLLVLTDVLVEGKGGAGVMQNFGQLEYRNLIIDGYDVGLNLAASDLKGGELRFRNCAKSGLSLFSRSNAQISACHLNNVGKGVLASGSSEVIIKNVQARKCDVAFTAQSDVPGIQGSKISVEQSDLAEVGSEFETDQNSVVKL